MAVSFGGLASGIDTSSWIEALVATKQASVTELEEKKEALQLTTDVLENVKTFFASFKGVLSTITNANLGIPSMDIFVQNIVESSNIENVSAIVNTTAEQASYEVNVDQLATETQATSLFYTTNTTYYSTIHYYHILLD